MLSAPSPIQGTIGVNIPPIPLQLFRYSDTPHAIELRCLNMKSSGIAWFNLVYQLTENIQPLGTTSASKHIKKTSALSFIIIVGPVGLLFTVYFGITF